jgi:hypothetical protein
MIGFIIFSICLHPYIIFSLFSIIKLATFVKNGCLNALETICHILYVGHLKELLNSPWSVPLASSSFLFLLTSS